MCLLPWELAQRWADDDAAVDPKNVPSTVFPKVFGFQWKRFAEFIVVRGCKRL